MQHNKYSESKSQLCLSTDHSQGTFRSDSPGPTLFLLKSFFLSHLYENRRQFTIIVFAYHKNVICAFLNIACMRVCCVCMCLRHTSLKSDLEWPPASFPCLLTFTYVSVDICQSPSLMVPRAVFRAMEQGEPFTIEIRCAGSSFSWSSVKVWLCLSISSPHSLEIILMGFHPSTQYWPIQRGIASAEILSLNHEWCIISIGH